MKKIAIISGSIRNGRLSHRVALFLKQHLTEYNDINTDLLDLKEFKFPLFEERFAFQEKPSERLIEFTDRFLNADGIILVSPVYNASFPAALKNVIDLYYAEWKHKPAAVVSVTSGPVPGIATIQSLQTLLLKLGAWVVPGLTTIINVGTNFDENGIATTPIEMKNLVNPMISDLRMLIK